MTKEEIDNRQIEAGACNPGDAQSTAAVEIQALKTKDGERTFCNFQCRKGYYDVSLGYTILFKCVPDEDKTSPTGKRTEPTFCQGA